MLDELIAKIAAQTGLPAETVAPVVGALLAHLGDVLPAPIAHHIAVALGVHQDDGTAAPEVAADSGAAGQPGIGGLLGGLLGGAGGAGQSPGAASLANAAQSLLGAFLASRR